VEFDAEGVRVAYWIKPSRGKQPGLLTDDYERVAAEIIRHLRLRPRRPGQTMGVPYTHAILQDLHDLNLLLIAALKKVQVSSCIAAFLKSPQATEDLFNATAETYGYVQDETIEPGMIYRMYPEEELQSFIPNFPNAEFEPFIILLARRIGSALGVSWQIVLKDFGQSNYSSARTDLLESRPTFTVLQNWLIEKDLRHEWFEVLSDARDRGDERLAGISDEDLKKVSYIPGGWDWVDPQKEALATKIKLGLKITNRRIECARQGLDWEEVLQQSVREEVTERDLRKEAGLPDLQADPDETEKAGKELAAVTEEN
jgi:lambda family phage portal protein